MNHLYDFMILLAKSSKFEAPAGPEGKGLSVSWAIVIFAVLLGLAISFTPTKRTTEIKRPKDE